MTDRGSVPEHIIHKLSNTQNKHVIASILLTQKALGCSNGDGPRGDGLTSQLCNSKICPGIDVKVQSYNTSSVQISVEVVEEVTDWMLLRVEKSKYYWRIDTAIISHKTDYRKESEPVFDCLFGI
ncbi:hypothetical protein DPMN_034686 [Dreissena polymorpha]|uniref:Uncharacterized protein n=1 Tax=Dreissena polymorpha TaxID=45954 RepID=A0A9D4RL76_DREPO|nr:hypothetical protein DPMN_034686 [Dreissena polymorpha]